MTDAEHTAAWLAGSRAATPYQRVRCAVCSVWAVRGVAQVKMWSEEIDGREIACAAWICRAHDLRFYVGASLGQAIAYSGFLWRQRT